MIQCTSSILCVSPVESMYSAEQTARTHIWPVTGSGKPSITVCQEMSGYFSLVPYSTVSSTASRTRIFSRFSRASSKASMRRAESDAEDTQRSITISTLEAGQAEDGQGRHHLQQGEPRSAGRRPARSQPIALFASCLLHSPRRLSPYPSSQERDFLFGLGRHQGRIAFDQLNDGSHPVDDHGVRLLALVEEHDLAAVLPAGVAGPKLRFVLVV